MTGEDGIRDMRIPVTVITGFLGAGKTTLLNRLLSQCSAKRFALVINEFGDIGIDGDLIVSPAEELIQLSSGCVCCVVRGDLIRELRAILARKKNLDGIIIETSGLANPSPVIQTLVIDQVIGAQCRLDSVVCVIDAVRIFDQLDGSGDACDQIALSDHIVMNKVADASDPILDIEARLRRINPFAPISRTNRCAISATEVFARFGFDLDRIETRFPSHPAALAHDHGDESGVNSVSLTCRDPLDAAKFERWLTDLLTRQGSDILRTKGVVSVAGEDRKLVVQAVNMMLEGDYSGKWESADRLSRLVFIGRKLDHDQLSCAFRNCRSQQGLDA